MGRRIAIGSRIKPLLLPKVLGCRAGENDFIVKPERTVRPEFDRDGHDAIADPIERPWHRAEREFGGILRGRLLQREAAFERTRLLAGPCADAALQGAACKISVASASLAFSTRPRTRTAAQRLPVKQQRCFHVLRELEPFGAFRIAIKNKAAGIV